MSLIYHPEAEAELIEAARFYEEQVSGLGAEFLDAIEQGITQILAAPERWRVVDGQVRRCLIPRFPYAIFYRNTVPLHVLAIKHHCRHPDYWRNRLIE